MLLLMAAGSTSPSAKGVAMGGKTASNMAVSAYHVPGASGHLGNVRKKNAGAACVRSSGVLVVLATA
jgi:hypothetical protein